MYEFYQYIKSCVHLNCAIIIFFTTISSYFELNE
jgi:hypothetical protein